MSVKSWKEVTRRRSRFHPFSVENLLRCETVQQLPVDDGSTNNNDDDTANNNGYDDYIAGNASLAQNTGDCPDNT
jgi:hypothetical protein